MLRDDEAHLWLASPDVVADPAVRDRCEGILNPDELVRYHRFVFEESKRQHLTAHALKRTVLSMYAPLAPAAWRFQSNQYGRPEIEPGLEQLGLRFNLSHTKGLIACLVVRDIDAGVDVEYMRQLSEPLKLAERFFAPHETATLRSLPPESVRTEFFNYWTLKESYIKGRGMGLALPLDGFWFRLDDPPALTVSAALGDDGSAWQCGLKTPSPDHRLAWAIRGGATPVSVSVRTLEVERLAA